MKRKLLIAALGIAASLSAATSARAVGLILLDNYADSGNIITYGSGFGPALEGTGLLNGTPLGVTWTVGFYYALGNVTGSVNNDPTGMADPSTLGGGLMFATGAPGDTTPIVGPPMYPSGGYFESTATALINGYVSGPITLEMVVYSGSSYADSTLRAHSSAFTMTPSTGANPAPLVGAFMPGFSVNIPEPSSLALAGLGFATLIAFRRRP